MSPADAIERLRRRVEWLDRRIENTQKTRRLTFDEAERNALRYAIEHLETCRELGVEGT